MNEKKSTECCKFAWFRYTGVVSLHQKNTNQYSNIMKIILEIHVVADMASRSPEEVMSILNQCKKLAMLDNEAIEKYEIDPEAPKPLIEIIENMKKRAIAARRRKENKLKLLHSAIVEDIIEHQAKTRKTVHIPEVFYDALELLATRTVVKNRRQVEAVFDLFRLLIDRFHDPEFIAVAKDNGVDLEPIVKPKAEHAA